MTCGTAPRLIRVSARVEDSRRVYNAAIPWEYRDEVCSFVWQQLGFDIPVQGSVLVLTEKQTGAVVALAMSINVALSADTETSEPQ